MDLTDFQQHAILELIRTQKVPFWVDVREDINAVSMINHEEQVGVTVVAQSVLCTRPVKVGGVLTVQVQVVSLDTAIGFLNG